MKTKSGPVARKKQSVTGYSKFQIHLAEKSRGLAPETCFELFQGFSGVLIKSRNEGLNQAVASLIPVDILQAYFRNKPILSIPRVQREIVSEN